MGMATGSPVYNRNSGQNPHEPGNLHGRSGGHDNVVKPLASEPVESSHAPDIIGPYRENDHIRNMEMDLRKKSVHGKEVSSQTSGNQGSTFIKNAKSLESTGSFNEFDHIAARKMDGVASNTLESSSRLPATAKEPSTF
ncbi:hypothetical protein KIW84_065456 [Lathyrus oleraceus]|uniref:Uncharacterized protein n=1 Tax=Pisum sativum TaxID=3888 RepID=A0A9D4WH61_PEA|nr:hypothetical protein KIW84_065456 [Pisum sativum]